MKSLKTLLILGPGPSSSHTIGPFRIANDFLLKIDGLGATHIDVYLYGSLALTGKGHDTPKIIKEAFAPLPTEIYFKTTFDGLTHPNTMECVAYSKKKEVLRRRYQSIGGGAFALEGEKVEGKEIYPFSSFDELKMLAAKENIGDLYGIIEKYDGPDILEYAKDMLDHSFATIEQSLQKSGILPGKLQLKRVAKDIYANADMVKEEGERRLLLLSAYAYATAEANAAREMIVTAPTCGAAGVVPACLYYEKKRGSYGDEALAKSYLVGALMCSFIKENAGASGALLGCQSEIGSAASFAAASLAYLHNLSIHQIEYASEVAMEHFLGLTCDPVDGYVQIPCIERNGMAAIHAYSSYVYAKDIAPYRQNKVSFDKVVEAMKETGKGLPNELKETGLGGLAKVLC